MVDPGSGDPVLWVLAARETVGTRPQPRGDNSPSAETSPEAPKLGKRPKVPDCRRSTFSGDGNASCTLEQAEERS
jgi:hypothetical protein